MPLDPNSNASATTTVEPTQDSPIQGDLQAPATQPAQQPMQLQPGQPQPERQADAQPPHNPRHSLIGRTYDTILSGLGGAQSESAITDSDPKSPTYGQTKMVPTPKTPGSQWRSIISSMLTGLAAGAEVPQPKSGAASVAAGLGAGFGAQTQKTKEERQQKIGESKEDFAQEQKALLQQHDIARTNALTLTNYMQNLKTGNDMNPEYASNKELAENFKSAGVPVDYVSKESLQQKLNSQNPEDQKWVATHFAVPIGFQPVLGDDGQPLLDAQKNPKSQGMVAVISGLHDGKAPLPASLAAEIQKFGDNTGIQNYSAIKAGDEYDMATIGQYMHRVADAKNKVLQGWQKPEVVWQGQGKDRKQVLFNPLAPKGEQLRPMPEGVTTLGPEEESKIAKEGSEVGKNKAEGDKFEGEAAKARSEAAANSGDVVQATAQRLVEANEDPTQMTKRSKNYDATLKAADEYSQAKYGKPFDMAQAQSDYTFAKSVGTQNVIKYTGALTDKGGNLDKLQEMSDKYSRTNFPSLNKVENWARLESGNPEIAAYHTMLVGVQDEFAKIISGASGGAVTTDAARKQASDMIEAGLAKKQMRAVLGTMRSMVGTRVSSFIGDNRYLKKQYPQYSGGQPQQNPQSGQTQNASQTWSASAWQKTNPGKDVNAAIAAAKAAGHTVVQ